MYNDSPRIFYESVYLCVDCCFSLDLFSYPFCSSGPMCVVFICRVRLNTGTCVVSLSVEWLPFDV